MAKHTCTYINYVGKAESRVGRMWDLIVSVPDHCLSFYFTYQTSYLFTLDVLKAE